MNHLNEIRERIEREQYEVDASAVATAIVRRLLEGGMLALPAGRP